MERARFDELSHYEPYHAKSWIPSKTSMWKLTMELQWTNGSTAGPSTLLGECDRCATPSIGTVLSKTMMVDLIANHLMVCSGGIKFAALNHG
jgi:hypothetical protein